MIKIKNLKKCYGDTEIFNNVNIEIKKGQIYGIIGHSGAGKSTLLRCINGLEKYQAGELKVMDRDIGNLSDEEMRNIRKSVGMIFQQFNLLNRSTVAENVELPMKIWKYPKEERKRKVNELLNMVGLSHKMNSKPRELSGGEKQRVAIARALTLNPEILLCDEATSALDPQITKDILKLLERINRELGITIVVVTHEMDVIKDICEEVTFLKKGRIEAQGKVEDIFLKPESSLKEFLGEEDEFIGEEGNNIRIYFPIDAGKDALITSMARNLNIDFSIVWGKLEKFRDKVMGSLVIKIKDEDIGKVKKYLEEENYLWEEI